MRPRAKLLLAAVALLLVLFTFLSHAHSETRGSIYVPDHESLPVEVPTPPIFDNLLLSAKEEAPEPTVRIPRFRQMQLALARICVSESGFQVHTNDCNLIYQALRTRSSTGELTLAIMRSYSRRSFDRTRTDRRRWIAHLNHEFREPSGWEIISVPWSTRRQGFINVYEYAGHLIRTRPANKCGVRIDHWGAPGFRRDMHLEQGWRLVECGETLNDFWTIPRRERPTSRANREVTSHSAESASH